MIGIYCRFCCKGSHRKAEMLRHISLRTRLTASGLKPPKRRLAQRSGIIGHLFQNTRYKMPSPANREFTHRAQMVSSRDLAICFSETSQRPISRFEPQCQSDHGAVKFFGSPTPGLHHPHRKRFCILTTASYPKHQPVHISLH